VEIGDLKIDCWQYRFHIYFTAAGGGGGDGSLHFLVRRTFSA
jgi:hypothetical protein